MSSNLYAASRQWSSRPADERFWNITELYNAVRHEKQTAEERLSPFHSLKACGENGEVVIRRATGSRPIQLTNWAFNQLSIKSGAPAGYLQKLPAELAAQNLNHGIHSCDNDTVNLLLHKEDGGFIRSLNTEKYSRIWNVDILQKLQPACDAGWMTPPARPAGIDDERTKIATASDILPGQENFGLSVRVGDKIAPAGVYCGDRDMFIFMVNPKRLIDDGVKGLMRGFFLQNSEVGAQAFKIRSFYLQNVCGNHIVWGVSNISELKIVHKGRANARFGSEMQMRLRRYADETTVIEEKMIRLARHHELGKNRGEALGFLYNKKQSLGIPSNRVIDNSFALAEKYEHEAKSAPTTVWGFVNGLTRYSQNCPNADERNDLDSAGGKLLEWTMKQHNN